MDETTVEQNKFRQSQKNQFHEINSVAFQLRAISNASPLPNPGDIWQCNIFACHNWEDAIGI